MRAESRWRRGLIFSAILVVLVLIVAVALRVLARDNNTSKTQTTVSAVNHDLTVKPSDLLPEQARCTSDEFIANSLPNSNLSWSDSVSTPFVSSDASTMLTELLTENCGNPTVLAMNIEALSTIPIEDGATIGSVNPWMAEFVSAFNKDDLSFLTKKANSGDKLFVTPDYQKYAAMTNTVLLRIKVIEVASKQSLTNWHVAARSGLAVGGIPRATLNPTQESLPALKMEYTLKTGQCLFAIGFNIADKRFETLACTTKSKTPTPASTQSVPAPKPTPTPTTPAPKPRPTPTPTLSPKDKAVEPASKGNAPVGEGTNKNPGTDVYRAPAEMVQPPATVPVTPAPPAVTTPPVLSTPDPAPAPSPQVSAPPASAPATGCAPAPGMTTC